jgi:hypothetical protein
VGRICDCTMDGSPSVTTRAKTVGRHHAHIKPPFKPTRSCTHEITKDWFAHHRRFHVRLNNRHAKLNNPNLDCNRCTCCGKSRDMTHLVSTTLTKSPTPCNNGGSDRKGRDPTIKHHPRVPRGSVRKSKPRASAKWGKSFATVSPTRQLAGHFADCQQ